MSYSILLHEDALKKAEALRQSIRNRKTAPGARLTAVMTSSATATATIGDFIDSLLKTKQPHLFAESQIKADGTDWTAAELSVLGDLSLMLDCQVYDNGVWSLNDRHFKQYPQPVEASLIFVPGPLLDMHAPAISPDFAECANKQGRLLPDRYDALIERRLLPALLAASQDAEQRGVKAVLSIPGLGCGAFAGRFQGHMGRHLNRAVTKTLSKHAHQLAGIASVTLDTFTEGPVENWRFGSLAYRRTVYGRGDGLPALSTAAAFNTAANGPAVPDTPLRLYKIVAWDHASYPGNDFFRGKRLTDDGVAAAATSSMQAVTGVEGRYHAGAYAPPDGYKNWESVVREKNIRIGVTAPVRVAAVIDEPTGARLGFVFIPTPARTQPLPMKFVTP